MNPRHASAQVQHALADYANDVKMNGLSTWDYQDFTVSADKFVNHLMMTAQLRASGAFKLDTQEAVLDDMAENLGTDWGMPAGYCRVAIEIGLFEVGPYYMEDLEFEF